MSIPRLLVTGAAGFVGSSIMRLAARTGWEVHGLARSISNTRRLDDLNPAITLHYADLRNATDVEGVVRAVKPDCVVHAAFSSAHPKDASARREMLETAFGGTLNLIEAMRVTQSGQHLIYVGSATVYGPSEQPHDPQDPLRPVTFRGVCKAGASWLCREFSLSTGRSGAEVRLFSTYGPWEQPERLLPRLWHAALSGRTIQLAAEPRRRNWIFAEDAAAACLSAARATSLGGLVFNACTNEVISTHQVAQMVENMVGQRLVGGYDYPIADAYGNPHPRAELSGSAEGVDWRPTTSLEGGLRQTWAWAQTPAGRRHLNLD